MILAITPAIVITRTFLIAHAQTLPAAFAGPTYIETQTETFTCGVHALHCIYRAYDLDPNKERIRWRLGVDTKALFWLKDSTGALHPDVFMVLRQDGFRVLSIEMGDLESHEKLLSHLCSGNMALLLIKRRENGNLHWVAAACGRGERYLVYDSLFRAPYEEDRQFTDSFVMTALAIAPSGQLQTGIWQSLGHLIEGSQELKRFNARYP